MKRLRVWLAGCRLVGATEPGIISGGLAAVDDEGMIDMHASDW